MSSEFLGLVGALLGAAIGGVVTLYATRATLSSHSETFEFQITQHRESLRQDNFHRDTDRAIGRFQDLAAVRAEAAVTFQAIEELDLASENHPIAPLGYSKIEQAAQYLVGQTWSTDFSDRTIMRYIQLCRTWNTVAEIVNSTITAAGSANIAIRSAVLQELTKSVRPELLELRSPTEDALTQACDLAEARCEALRAEIPTGELAK